MKRSAENGGTRTMCYADDLRYDFNVMINSTSCLTNNIKVLSQQALQYGQETDLGVGCDVVLDSFQSAERSYLGKEEIRRYQLLGAAAAKMGDD
ncbi:hypothetical protein PAHAL_9G221700 [Panicum hallii]|uniref:Uncharacterized protein n=1 Tax=Panicum hallii TaxID=206008 RepID=A0A2T8I226_9POAL|nr:hypothetical protein PAHAL_9G221700 [Panicum hallii]